MAAGDLYTVRIQYAALFQDMENAFHILQESGTGDSVSLAEAIELNYIPAMKAIQSVSVVYVQTVVVNLDNTTDFATVATSGNGLITGDTMPPYVSWGYTIFSSNTKIRSGGKRVGVPGEASVINGLAIAGIESLLDVLSVVWNSTFEDTPMLNSYKMVLHTDGNTETAGLPLTVPVRSVLYRRVTTQSSRKYPA